MGDIIWTVVDGHGDHICRAILSSRTFTGRPHCSLFLIWLVKKHPLGTLAVLLHESGLNWTVNINCNMASVHGNIREIVSCLIKLHTYLKKYTGLFKKKMPKLSYILIQEWQKTRCSFLYWSDTICISHVFFIETCVIHVRGDTPSRWDQPYMTQPVLPGRVSLSVGGWTVGRSCIQMQCSKSTWKLTWTNLQKKQVIYYSGSNTVQWHVYWQCTWKFQLFWVLI